MSTHSRVHHLGAHELLLEHAAQLDFIIVHSWEIFGSVVIGVVLSHLPQVLVEISTLAWLGVFVTLVALRAAWTELFRCLPKRGGLAVPATNQRPDVPPEL